MPDVGGSAAPGAAGGSFFGPPGALIGAGIGAATAVIGGASSAKANRKMQEDAQRWQRYMRGTQYQATVEDMKKAGINPMALYAGSGLSQGMSSPMASAGQVGEGIQKAGGKVSEGLMLGAQLKQISSATALNEEMAAKARQDAALIHTQTYTEGAKGHIAQVEAEFKRIQMGIQLENMVRDGILTQANADAIRSDMGLNENRRAQMNAQASAAQASAAATRAGIPRTEFESSALGIALREARESVSAVGDLKNFKFGSKDYQKSNTSYRRSLQRVYQNP